MSVLSGCQATQSIGEVAQDNAHTPRPWRALSADEQATFDLGYALFNTEWSPANQPPGRRDGLGPIFNAQSCDACHNARRRGRGPRTDGDAPADLVIQLGRRLSDGSVERGIDEYGRILNTSAIQGFIREASVFIHYEEEVRVLDDGSRVSLRVPRYQVGDLSGPSLPASTVLMPRMPPSVQGAGLFELVPQAALLALAESERKGSSVHGRVSWLAMNEGRLIGRFGWQATEPSVAAQTASAFSKEMGLTTPLISHIDCGLANHACQTAETGGTPEVEAQLFDALLFFQRLHAVPLEKANLAAPPNALLFTQLGCTECHHPSLRIVTPQRRSRQTIHAYTDLLLHDLGSGLADRDLDGNAIHSEWRTAPLWGMHASVTSGQPLRLLHDGRARTIEEAILWHDGEARTARERYARLRFDQRRALAAWIAQR